MENKEALAQDDAQYLESLGYKQELSRVMSGFSNFAISFSIISILTGAIALYGYGLTWAGPGANGILWPLVCMVTLTVAASMAEISSAYPTAGGLYYWSTALGNKHWGWWTAWFNLIGLIALVAAVFYPAAGFFNYVVLGQIFGMEPSPNAQLMTAAVFIMTAGILNVAGARIIALMNDLSVWVHVVGVFAIAIFLFLMGKYSQPISFAFLLQPTGESAQSYPLWGALAIGLLQAQWTLTGYDASAHVAEETVSARQASAKGIFNSVLISALVGYILLLAITLRLPSDLGAVTGSTYAVVYVLQENLGGLGTGLSVIITLAMILCGMSSMASASRMVFAFARDGGLPASNWLKQVSPTHHTPQNATIFLVVLSILFCAWAQLLTVLVAVNTTALYVAYGIPIFLSLTTKKQSFRNRVVWSLGGKSKLIAAIAVLWIAFITVLFNWPVDGNWLPLQAFGGSILFMLVYYFAWARHNFEGPYVPDYD